MILASTSVDDAARPSSVAQSEALHKYILSHFYIFSVGVSSGFGV
jgi:hypothetical protein